MSLSDNSSFLKCVHIDLLDIQNRVAGNLCHPVKLQFNRVAPSRAARVAFRSNEWPPTAPKAALR
jgi:hypothetical protein